MSSFVKYRLAELEPQQQPVRFTYRCDNCRTIVFTSRKHYRERRGQDLCLRCIRTVEAVYL